MGKQHSAGLGLRRIAAIDLETARLCAAQAGFAQFVLPTSGVVDRATFFDAARATFPLDPPVLGSTIWDALADSLWEGLYQCPHRRIVIVWQGTQAMATGAPADFEIALGVLAQVAGLLADHAATCGAPKEVAVLVEEARSR